jgi:hypothetical protein
MPISALSPAASNVYSLLREKDGTRAPGASSGSGPNPTNGIVGSNGNVDGNTNGNLSGSNNGIASPGGNNKGGTDRVGAASGPAKERNDSQGPGNANGKADPTQLSDEALTLLAKLKSRDLEVRQHEAAHLAVAGGLATSGASFTYQKGPDGVNYAIGGEVGIDLSPGRTPQETIERARIVQAAALAPAEPSGPDLAVAAAAEQLQQQARAELAQQQAKDLGDGSSTQPVSGGSNLAPNGATPAQATSATDAIGTIGAIGRKSPEAGQRALEQRDNLNRLYGVGNRANSTTSLSIFA